VGFEQDCVIAEVADLARLDPINGPTPGRGWTGSLLKLHLSASPLRIPLVDAVVDRVPENALTPSFNGPAAKEGRPRIVKFYLTRHALGHGFNITRPDPLRIAGFR